MNRLTVLWMEPSTAVMNEACKCAPTLSIKSSKSYINSFLLFYGGPGFLCSFVLSHENIYVKIRFLVTFLSPSAPAASSPAVSLPWVISNPHQCLIVRFGSYFRAQRWKSCRETPSANTWIFTSSLEGYPRRLKGFLMRENLPGNCNS